MKRLYAVLAAPLLILAGCAANMSPDPAGTQFFNSLTPVPQQLFGAADDVIAHYLAPTGRAFPTTRELRSDTSATGQTILLFSAEGYEDDSLAGEQWRVVLRQADGGVQVVEAGKRYKCYRVQQGQWRKPLCL